ncbi:MAG: T9SS type A sorting domain-containing protein, partial [Chitinophagaceae bacterium]|nr:T9SS type A sorting domain-containing protein [Chitinophagaceae bacterium]
LILLALLGAYTSSFAFLTQSTWRWRNNDGSETTATWRANQNTGIAYNSIHEVLRLRYEIYNTNGSTTQTEDSLQYTTTPAVASSWVNIGTYTGKAFILASSINTVTQNQATTSQITGNAYVYFPGKTMVTDSVAVGVFIPPSNRTEIEWAIIGTNNTSLGATYYFRHWGATANNLPPGATYASLTTGAILPIKLSGFSVKGEGSKVKIQWSTESEQNNDRFEVERSANGRTWEAISTVKGKGTFSSTTNYSAYDNSPLKGTNYYRLQQYDINGKSAFSDVKSLKFGTVKTVITVSPNPARGVINFKLENESAKSVLAILSDANGKIIYQQTFNDVQANTFNKLNLQQPTAGIYILKLKGEGLSESIKVVVQ